MRSVVHWPLVYHVSHFCSHQYSSKAHKFFCFLIFLHRAKWRIQFSFRWLSAACTRTHSFIPNIPYILVLFWYFCISFAWNGKQKCRTRVTTVTAWAGHRRRHNFFSARRMQFNLDYIYLNNAFIAMAFYSWNKYRRFLASCCRPGGQYIYI